MNDDWTPGQDQQITEQLEVLNNDFSTTTRSMLWNSELSEQLPEATYGGKDMKIEFRLKTLTNNQEGHKYYSLIHPDSPGGWNANWVKGVDIGTFGPYTPGETLACDAYGCDYNGEDSKTLNVFFSNESLESGWLGYAQINPSTFGTSAWGCWVKTTTMPSERGGVRHWKNTQS
jgi:hypothetical protein